MGFDSRRYSLSRFYNPKLNKIMWTYIKVFVTYRLNLLGEIFNLRVSEDWMFYRYLIYELGEDKAKALWTGSVIHYITNKDKINGKWATRRNKKAIIEITRHETRVIPPEELKSVTLRVIWRKITGKDTSLDWTREQLVNRVRNMLWQVSKKTSDFQDVISTYEK